MNCPWCSQPFEPVTRGDQQKRFCSTRCRHEFNTALRSWARKQLDQGKTTLAEIRLLHSPCTARSHEDHG